MVVGPERRHWSLNPKHLTPIPHLTKMDRLYQAKVRWSQQLGLRLGQDNVECQESDQKDCDLNLAYVDPWEKMLSKAAEEETAGADVEVGFQSRIGDHEVSSKNEEETKHVTSVPMGNADRLETRDPLVAVNQTHKDIPIAV